MSIQQWPESQRPRERLLQYGAQALSDAELLAIFLRTGVKGISAVELAQNVLKAQGSLQALLGASEAEFCQTHGLGRAKYVQLQAVLEMTRRYLAEQLEESCVFESADSVRQFLRLKMASLDQEVFAVLFLNSQHQLIEFAPMFYGTISKAAVYPREIIKKALAVNAAAIILAHNHPSGTVTPSPADEQITENIQQAANLLDIKVLDHFIVTNQAVYSFAEHGLL